MQLLSYFLINLINFKRNVMWQIFFFFFSLITQVSFWVITHQEKKKITLFSPLLFDYLFFSSYPHRGFTFILEGVDACPLLHMAEQEARCYWLIHKWRDSRAVWKHFHSCTPKILCSSQAGQLSHSGAAELLLPACRDTGRSLALSGTAFTISS